MIHFEGALESTAIATPIRRAWMFTWEAGAVAEVRGGAPTLDTTFVASVPGQWGDEASLVSRHESGGAGGCWWPAGGGGVAACPDEVRARGGCGVPVPPCAGSRGCVPLDVEERRSGAPGPEQPRRIEVEDTRPSDAGPDAGPDAGLSDAEPM